MTSFGYPLRERAFSKAFRRCSVSNVEPNSQPMISQLKRSLIANR
ncbi:hypothetical protein LEP1GSC074_0736 [Leptospira noguchii str. Hook]|nr:hypothetical protein LEP1GSC074_0736 [Leptospira noguchii str. Hook]